MKKMLFVIVFLMFKLSGYAQSKDSSEPLYLLSGTLSNANSDYYYKTFFLKVNKSMSLDTVALISDNVEALEQLKIYQDLGFLVYQKDSNIVDFKIKKGSLLNTKYFYRINFSTPNKIDSIKLTLDKYLTVGLLPSPMLIVKDKIPFFMYENVDFEKVFQFGIDLKTFNRTRLSDSDFKYAYLVGEPGGSKIGATEGLNFIIDSLNQIRLPVTYDFSKRPILEIKPKNKIVYPFKRGSVYINNDYFLLLTGKPLQPTSPHTTTSVIYNKISREIFPFTIPCDYPVMHGFNEWITGMTANYATKKDYKPSIGQEFRKNKQTITGFLFDHKTEKNSQIFDGKLFLFNTTTKNYIEIDTKQGDSEIILINKNKVYYRVFDEIFEGNIGNGQIENVKKIIKHPLIEDVHWAFIGQ